jgi:hypothetical protein
VRTERFDTPGPVTLALKVPAGNVEIETTDAGVSTVELEPLRDDHATITAIERATVELHGNDLIVDLEGERRRLFFLRGVDVGVRISVPHDTRLRVNVVNADVRAPGRFGSSEVRTVSGDLLLGDFDGEANLRSVSGDITVGRVSGSATIESVSGDLKLEDAAKDVRAKSVSGDVRLARVCMGEVSVQTVSGDARIGVAPGSKLFIDAKSLSGDMASDLELSEEPAQGEGPSLEIRGKSVSGDLKITRA